MKQAKLNRAGSNR